MAAAGCRMATTRIIAESTNRNAVYFYERAPLSHDPKPGAVNNRERARGMAVAFPANNYRQFAIDSHKALRPASLGAGSANSIDVISRYKRHLV
jgi:hypothetical protein